ncbi:MAG: cyclic nucleotide-binding domain-containing protein [Desulforhopalus sp.]|nr:cyclic nucleotide-binding domain-containing protein [Desulforhopalus sp.]
MDIDQERQQKIIVKTQKFLHTNERKRRLLRLQRGIAQLHNDRFAVLENSEFVEALIDYLPTEYQENSTNSIRKILDKIGSCACSTNKEQRERAVFILSVVAEKILHDNNDAEFLEIVSLHLVNWLQVETEYLSGFHFICLQLQTMLQNMLRLGLWYQTENLVIVLSQIQKGVIQKSDIIRKIICQVHADLADEAFLRKLVDVLLDKKEDRRDIAQCLLMNLGSKAAAVLVQTLIDCQDKEKRFALIEFIPTTGKVVVPVCDYCLKQNPPWYVVRNLIIIISRLADANLYEMVRPHLTHKDIRVQMQILNCITKLGGASMRDRLIEALAHISDELKTQVIVQLGNLGGKDVGNALCDLLEKRDQFAVHVRDELLLTICNKIKFEPSPRALKSVRQFLNQRKQQVDEGEKVLLAAEDALMSLELKMPQEAEAETEILPPVQQTVSPIEDDLFIVPVATEEEFDRLLQEKMTAMAQEKLIQPTVEPEARKVDKKQTAKKKAGKKIAEVADNDEMARHCQVWKRFYAAMTEEESKVFRAALQFRTYQPGEMIVARGNLQPSLHLFDTGAVRLVRNKAGEESYLRDLSAGDLIGSDIFLSGEPWNLSLYAGMEASGHVFNLEELLETQVDFPELADKIFSYCAGRDILLTLLRMQDTSYGSAREEVRLVKTGGQPQHAVILRKLQGGLGLCVPVKHTEKISRLQHWSLKCTLRLSSGQKHSVAAAVIGVVRSIGKSAEVVVFAQFEKLLGDALYKCESIEVTELA